MRLGGRLRKKNKNKKKKREKRKRLWLRGPFDKKVKTNQGQTIP
jgi:hypothetical protein